jgi:peptidoglycan/LPS O-acetylase OafA/YrhL
MTKLQTSEFRHATNLLRGLSALSILVWHYQHFFYVGTQRPADWDPSIQPLWSFFKPAYLYGEFAVQIFWCISGLILAHAYINQSKTRLAKFGLARFSRLYPLHLLTLVVVAIIQFSSKQWFETFQIYSQNDISHFFKNLFFIQAWGPLGDGFSFNTPTWSVSVEIVVYFIFFALLRILHKTKIFFSFALVLLMRVLINVYPTLSDQVFFYECLMYFLTGVSVYFVIVLPKPVFRIPLLLGLIAIIPFIIPDFRNKNISLVVITFVCTAAYLDTFPLANRLQRVRIVGELTYSVFLWHAPLQMIILMVMMQFDISHSIAQSPLFLLFFLVLTYSVGYVSYRWIEQPARKFLNNRFMPAR